MQLKDRFRGALLGLAVGDALGGPLEFQPAREPDDYVREMIGGGWQQLAPGEWTDDTQMTLCTVESLLAKKVFDPDDIAQRFVRWLDSKPNDIGMHTKSVLESIKSGTSWEDSSRNAQEINPDNAPNGSLMRCAPLALFFYKHPDFAASLSPLLSRITHAHADCEYACVLLNVMITHLLQAADPMDSLDSAYKECEGASLEFKKRIHDSALLKCITSPSGWVLDTLEVALWSFLHGPNFEGALVFAINRGDDADTVGAVTGALAGAYYGLSGIPERWLEPLKDRERLIEYADQLFELSSLNS